MRRLALFATLLLALLAPAAAGAQRRDSVQTQSQTQSASTTQTRNPGSPQAQTQTTTTTTTTTTVQTQGAGAARARRATTTRTRVAAQAPARNVIRYSARTGAVTGLPLVPGRTYDIVVHDLNALCYAYTAEITVKEDNTDLSKVIAALGTLPGGSAPAKPQTPAAPPAAPVAPPAAGPAGAPGAAPAAPLAPGVAAQALSDAIKAIGRAEVALRRLGDAATTVDGLVSEVNSPACSRTTSFDALEQRWQSSAPLRGQVVGWERTIDDVQKDLETATGLLVIAGTEPGADQARSQVAAAQADAIKLALKLATLVPELLTAQGAIASASEQTELQTQAYLPAGTTSVDFLLRITEVKPKDPAKPGTTELKSTLAIHRGMRVFLSAGFLASAANLHDFERTNRPCPVPATFTPCETTYSTYVDRAPGGAGFAFSPVLQANVAFRDVNSAGVSLHGSAGVAARSVNGAVSPEFIVGAGAGFLDRILLTFGLHLARDEKLLLGSPSVVDDGPVSDKITVSDAVGVVWRSAFAATVSFRLTN